MSAPQQVRLTPLTAISPAPHASPVATGPQYLTVKETCAFLRIGKTGFYRLRQEPEYDP